ncbi:hypothetical protein D3C84_699440 [compost metagenome]
MLQLIGQIEQVVTLDQLSSDPFDIATGQFLLELHNCHWRFLAGNLDGLQIEVRIAARKALHRDTAHRDLLHQLLVVGVERIEPMDLVVIGLVSSGVTQHHQGVKVHQRIQRLTTFHLLRLIQD